MARFFFLSLYFFCAFLFCKFLFSEARLHFPLFLVGPSACRSDWTSCALDDELARQRLEEFDALEVKCRERGGSGDGETVQSDSVDEAAVELEFGGESRTVQCRCSPAFRDLTLVERRTQVNNSFSFALGLLAGTLF